MSLPSHPVVNCPACHTALQIPSELIGKDVKCPQCERPFTVAAGPIPQPSPAPVVVPVSAPTAGLAPTDDNPFDLPTDPRPERDDRDAPRPPSPRRARAQTPDPDAGAGQMRTRVLIGGGVGLGLLVLVGGVLALRYAASDSTKPPPPAPQVKDQPKPKKDKAADKTPTEPATTPDGKMTDTTREKVKGATVYVRTLYADGKASSGSGFFAAGPGLIVTNAHVIGKTQKVPPAVDEVQVVINSGLPDARTLEAKVLKFDPALDLALLKIDAPAPPPLEVIDSFKLKETQEVYIFGFPGGENLGTNISVNISSISSLRRDDVVPWIQVAGGMHPGNSGGPVTDAAGRVIGVARAGIRGTQINMAIPGDTVYAFFHSAGDLIPAKSK